MQYREFGNTGVKISALGFGAMRLPGEEKDGQFIIDEETSIKIIHRAFELGVNYIDTAYGYCGGKSEIVVGKALKGYRDKVYLSTKMSTWNVKQHGDYRRFLEEQLKKLDVDYIDFYHFHSLGKDRWENIVLKYDLVKEAYQAKSEGLIKHISFSFHDKPEVMMQLIDTGIFETVLCQYNLLDRANEEAIAYAKSKGLGVAIMGPVGGGRLASASEIITGAMKGKAKSTPEVALRFVLANPNVSCALSGMSTIEMVEENARVASIEEPLSAEDWENINITFERTKKLADLYCTGCEYCLPCPQGINIPKVFSIMNYHKVYGLTEYAKKQYENLGKKEEFGSSPEDCIECGQCEDKCPQFIKIRDQLKRIQKEFSAL
ncbi:MAG TPA: 4Fe-4S dicluster domain-containing protein [Clostridiaceae bacterium]|nr:4Fe-4S dicluster domain-containing protein [Clostridiaceae bacterium]